MVEKLDNIVRYLDDILRTKKDEGLLLRRKENIKRIGLALALNHKVLEEASKRSADLLLIFNRRINKKLIKKTDMSIYLSKTPLKSSERLDTERSLADKLGITIEGSFSEGGVYGKIDLTDLTSFSERIHKILGIKPKIKKNDEKINRVAIAPPFYSKKWIKEAEKVGADTCLGNFNKSIFLKRTNMNFILGTKYALQAFGIIHLGELLEKKFKIDFFFID